MIGLGYRREMSEWDMRHVLADFYEVAPENWVNRDLAALHRLSDTGKRLNLHGVSLNLGGRSPLNHDFLHGVKSLMCELDVEHYSDHLASSGDAHQLYDLFPIPLTEMEALRVAERIQQVQDILGCRIGVENTTWYTNIGEMDEADFVNLVLEKADCKLLLDINNLAVNYKNHGLVSPEQFVGKTDLQRVSYLHVAGHDFDPRFELFMDTHSGPVEAATKNLAGLLAQDFGFPVLLEWDNDIPDVFTVNRELRCLKHSLTLSVA